MGIWKPSALDECLAKLPLKWQLVAMQAIAEECQRWKNKRFTPEEKKYFATVEKLAETAYKYKEEKVLRLITNHST